jgi:hypothetical protein
MESFQLGKYFNMRFISGKTRLLNYLTVTGSFIIETCLLSPGAATCKANFNVNVTRNNEKPKTIISINLFIKYVNLQK